MSIKELIEFAKKFAIKMIKNPNLYIAALVGGLAGLGVGGAIGAVSGGFIGYTLQLLGGGCPALPYGIDINTSAGAIIGMGAGAAASAATIGALNVYNTYKLTSKTPSVSNENIKVILKETIIYSIELSAGMGVGALLGALKDPGYGTAIGGAAGLIVMLFVSDMRRRFIK